MKSLLGCLFVGAAVALTGCGKGDSGDSAGQNPLTAPADYVGAAGRAPQRAERTVDTASLNQAIQLFHAAEGRLPGSLNELVTKGYLPRLPDAPRGMQYNYDPASGKVSVVTAQ